MWAAVAAGAANGGYDTIGDASAAMAQLRGEHYTPDPAAAAVYDAAEMCSFVMAEAVQIFGGMGYMRETEINRLYRSAKLLEIGGGTQEVRKIIIAEELLKD